MKSEPLNPVQLYLLKTITPITPEQKEAKYQQHLKDQKEGNIATAFK